MKSTLGPPKGRRHIQEMSVETDLQTGNLWQELKETIDICWHMGAM